MRSAPAYFFSKWGVLTRLDYLNVWLQSRSLPARGRVGLEVRSQTNPVELQEL